MKRRLNFAGRSMMLACALAALAALSGCDATDEEDYDYTPPAGKGALIVDNKTSSDIDVYIDGVLQGQAGDDADTHFDLAPGEHRLVLDEEDGNRDFAADIDILEGRLTIVRVTYDVTDSSDFDATITLD